MSINISRTKNSYWLTLMIPTCLFTNEFIGTTKKNWLFVGEVFPSGCETLRGASGRVPQVRLVEEATNRGAGVNCSGPTWWFTAGNFNRDFWSYGTIKKWGLMRSKNPKNMFFFSHTFWGSLHCKSSSFFYVLYDQEQHRTHHSPFTSSCGERLPLFFITGQLFKAKLDEYLRNRLRKGDASRQIPMVARFFGKTWVLNGFFTSCLTIHIFVLLMLGRLGS